MTGQAMSGKRRALLVGGISAALATGALLLRPTLAADAAPQPGRYGDLLLAIDPDSEVLTGFEHADEIGAGTEKAPQFSCRFAIRGSRSASGGYDIVAWLPGERSSDESSAAKGRLKATESGATISFRTPPGGCQYRFAEGEAEYDREERHDWRSIRLTAADRAYFHAKPNERGVRKDFVLRGDPVGVLRADGDWLEVEFVGEKRVTRGWLASRDLYPDSPKN